MGRSPHHASHINSKKLLCRWEALPIAFVHVNQKGCSIDGSAPYVACPLTGFQHLAIFSPYLPPHGSELIENSAFN
jgi:hypothetical protein